MSCDSNDNELKLTHEYKYLLSYIRPLVDQLEKSKDAQLCLLWLSKLEQCPSYERSYRNKILSELCKQVKSNCLKPPFNVAPPKGSLRNVIFGEWKSGQWNTSQYSEVEPSTEDGYSNTSSYWVFHSDEKNSPKRQISSSGRGNSLVQNSRVKNSKSMKETNELPEGYGMPKTFQERPELSVRSSERTDQMIIERYQDIIKTLVSQQLKADASPNKYKKLLSTYEYKMAEVVHCLRKTEKENEVLKKRIESIAGDGDNIDNLRNDNETLQKKVLELENEKNLIVKKCQEIEKEKLLSLKDLMNKLSEAEKKIREGEKMYKNLEKKYEESYHSFENEFEAKISEKERIHLQEISTLENTVREKQGEINRLQEEINIQKAGFEKEINSLQQQIEKIYNSGLNKEKFKSLKMKARKLEKVRENMAVLFQSQLQHILAKKDFYIASLEMQLKMNTLESGGSTLSSDINSSFTQKIADLEDQYRKLLEDSEQQSIKRRQMDLQKIHLLEKQLLSLGGASVTEVGLSQISSSITPESTLGIDPSYSITN